MARSEYRIAAGTLTKAVLEANDDYLVENFPRQTDQPQAVFWAIEEPGELEDGVERVTGLDGYEGEFGLPNTTIVVTAMSGGMLAYWHSTLWDANAVTAAVTVKLRDRRLNATADGDYVVYNCLIHREQASDRRLLNGVVYGSVPFRLSRLTVAPATGAFSSAFSGAFDI